MSIYTIYKMDDFEQMESFSKIFIFTLTFKHFSENKTFPSFLRPFLAKLHQFYEEHPENFLSSIAVLSHREMPKNKSLTLTDLSILLAYWGHKYSIPMVASSVAILELFWGIQGYLN